MCDVLLGGSFNIGLFADPNWPVILDYKWKIYIKDGLDLILVDTDGSAGFNVSGHYIRGAWPAPLDTFVTIYVPFDAPTRYMTIDYNLSEIDAYKHFRGWADFTICSLSLPLPPGPPPDPSVYPVGPIITTINAQVRPPQTLCKRS